MWYNNLTVSQTFASHHSQNAHAWVGGGSLGGGWRKIKTGAADGVTNCFMMLSAARACGRPVDCFIVSNQIEQVVLR